MIPKFSEAAKHNFARSTKMPTSAPAITRYLEKKNNPSQKTINVDCNIITKWTVEKVMSKYYICRVFSEMEKFVFVDHVLAFCKQRLYYCNAHVWQYTIFNFNAYTSIQCVFQSRYTHETNFIKTVVVVFFFSFLLLFILFFCFMSSFYFNVCNTQNTLSEQRQNIWV